MYRHSAESIRESSRKMFVSLEEKTKYNNYENTLRKKDDSYNKIEVDNKIKELSDNTYNTVESTYVSESNTIDGYVKDLEILGNTVQNTEDLSDIKSVGELQEDGTYKMSIVSHGKNLFDGILELGALINESGITSNSGDCLRSVNFIKVRPNTYITLSNDMNYSNYIYEYDKDYKFIKYNPLKDNGKPNTVITTNETCYVKFRSTIREVQNNLNVKYQLEESDISTSYEPYKESRVDITLPYQLEKVGDVSDRLYYDEEEKAWCIDKNIDTKILNGNENWIQSGISENNRIYEFVYNFDEIVVYDAEGNKKINTISSVIPSIPQSVGVNTEGISNRGNNNRGFWLRLSFDTIPSNDIAILKQWLKDNNVLVKYHLAKTQKIILPLDIQIQLNSYANKTYIYTVSGEVDGTIKATLPKSVGASVQTLNNKTDMMIDRIENIESLKEGQNLSYESDKGFVVCENTNNGQIDNIKIEGKTLVNLYNTNNSIPFGTVTKPSIVDNIITITHSPTDGWVGVYTKQSDMTIKPNTVYTCIVDIISNTLTVDNNLYIEEVRNNSAFVSGIKLNSVGVHVFKLNSLDEIIYNYCSDIRVGSESEGTIQFKYMLLEGDYTQNPPSYFEGLMSVGGNVDEIEISSRKEDGNLFDKNNVMYNTITSTVTGAVSTNSNYVVSDLIPVASNKEYMSTNLTVVHFYDKDNKFISVIDTATSPQIFTTPYNCRFIRVRNWTPLATLHEKVDAINKNVVTSSLNTSDISCEYYKPYTKSLLYYNNLGELVPVPELHEWDSIEKHSDGKYYYHKRSEKVVLNGSEEWSDYLSDTSTAINHISFSLVIKNKIYTSNDTVVNTLVCDQFPTVSAYTSFRNDITGICDRESTVRIKIKRSKLSSENVAGFKSWLSSNNVTVVYQLAKEQVYECVNLNLDTYDNETMVMVNTGAITPNLSFNVSSHIGNTVSILRERLKQIEEEYINYKLTQDKLLLNTLYSSDRGSYSVSTLSSDYDYQELEEIDYELFEITKSVIEVGLNNYNITDMEELIDFYTIIGKFDYDMADVLFEMIENQINPPVIEIPEEEIEILPEI